MLNPWPNPLYHGVRLIIGFYRYILSIAYLQLGKFGTTMHQSQPVQFEIHLCLERNLNWVLPPYFPKHDGKSNLTLIGFNNRHVRLPLSYRRGYEVGFFFA